MARIVPFFVLLTSAAAFADTATITGKWQIHNSIAGNESDMACNLTQKEGDLTGTCTSDHGDVAITGKVDDKKVSWVYKSEYNGGPITLTYKGKSESADKITGTVFVEEFGAEGEFTATQSK